MGDSQAALREAANPDSGSRFSLKGDRDLHPGANWPALLALRGKPHRTCDLEGCGIEFLVTARSSDTAFHDVPLFIQIEAEVHCSAGASSLECDGIRSAERLLHHFRV